MELVRYTSPYDCKETLDLIEEIFGLDERELETPQLDGTEKEYNTDIVYLARESGELLGMIHASIPTGYPDIAGVSAMCTTVKARGKGVGKLLFKTIVEEMDRLGVKTSFLGTGNPIAAKLYSSFGYSYLPGSSVMIRMTEGGVVDFTREYFGRAEGRITVKPGDASMRMPIIPLALHNNGQVILDRNINLLTSRVFSQHYCMSLYPRYIKLEKAGGHFFGAFDERGVLGGVASIAKDDVGHDRADFFAVKSFESCIPDLIAALKGKSDDFYIEIADDDGGKQALIANYVSEEPTASSYSYNCFVIPTKKYRIK